MLILKLKKPVVNYKQKTIEERIHETYFLYYHNSHNNSIV